MAGAFFSEEVLFLSDEDDALSDDELFVSEDFVSEDDELSEEELELSAFSAVLEDDDEEDLPLPERLSVL